MNSKLMLKGTLTVACSGAISAALCSFLVDNLLRQENLFLAVFGGFCGAVVGAIAGVLFWGLLGAFDKALIGVFNFAGAFFGFIFGGLVGGFFGSLFLSFSIDWMGNDYPWFILPLIGTLWGTLGSVLEEVSGDKDEINKDKSKE